MPNPIQNGQGATSARAFTKQNFNIGVEGGFGGVTPVFYAGVTPPTEGWTIYQRRATGGPPHYANIRTASSTTELTTRLGYLGCTHTNYTLALNWAMTQADVMVLNFNYPSIVMNGIVYGWDARFSTSYPETGSEVSNLGAGINFNPLLYNGPAYTDKNHFVFDGADDYLRGKFETILNDCTISIWFKATSTQNYQYLLSLTNGSQAYSFHMDMNDPDGGNSYRTMWTYWNSGGSPLSAISSAGSVGGWNDSRWRNYTFVRDSTTKNYMNGTEVTSGVTRQGDQTTQFGNGAGYFLSIAKYDASSFGYFGGGVARVMIYNRALSAEEVQRNYYGGNVFNDNLTSGVSLSMIIDPFNPVSNNTAGSITDLTGGYEFTYENAVSFSNAAGGSLRLNSGRIYRASLGWYGNYTISFWVKYVGAVAATYFYTESFRGSGGCARIYSYFEATGKFTYAIWDNSSVGPYGTGSFAVTSSTNVGDGNWHQVTCMWSNGAHRAAGISIFVDGVLESSTPFVGNDGSYADMHIGGSFGCLGDNSHNCWLGTIMQYNNYALSNEEVLRNFNAHRDRYL
jgi:hypothetical protein